jgi:hypothetical protein
LYIFDLTKSSMPIAKSLCSRICQSWVFNLWILFPSALI